VNKYVFFNKQDDCNAPGTIISATNNSTSSTSDASGNAGKDDIQTATTTGSEEELTEAGIRSQLAREAAPDGNIYCRCQSQIHPTYRLDSSSRVERMHAQDLNQ
jgi:hypothetical protein